MYKSVAMLALAATMVHAGSALSEEKQAGEPVAGALAESAAVASAPPVSAPAVSAPAVSAPPGIVAPSGPVSDYDGPQSGGRYPMGPYGNQGWNGGPNNAMGGPNMGGPNMGGPNMGGPNMGSPNMGGPNMGGPNMGGPNMGGPNMGGPNMGGPNMGGPNMGGPNMGGPNMGGMRGYYPPQGGQAQRTCACAHMHHRGGQGPVMGQSAAMSQAGESSLGWHLDNIKRQIGITEAQETAWQAYADSLIEQVAVHGEKHKQMMAMANMNSLQKAEARLQHMEKSLEKRRTSVTAYNKLFNLLTDEQKMLADRTLSALPMTGGM